MSRVDFGSRRKSWDGGRAQQSPARGLWEGLGRAGPARGSPAGNLQHRGCFVIPRSIFHPPPGAFLAAGDNGAGPHPSCDSTRRREPGLGDSVTAVPAPSCQDRNPPRAQGSTGTPVCHGTTAWWLLCTGGSASRAGTGFRGDRSCDIPCSPHFLAECLCPMGSLGWVKEHGSEWEAGGSWRARWELCF